MSVLYRAAIFLGAFLLFQIQLIIAKYLLPWFGGTPAVLTACMLFFQFTLLLSYLYADVLNRRFRLRTAALIHCGLLLASMSVVLIRYWVYGTAITPGESWKDHAGMPLATIIALLTVVTGFPYFVLATTSPLLQAWHSRTQGAGDTYRLYALSNAGSLLGLLTYPFLFERFLRLKTQAGVWSETYLVFSLVCLLVAATVAKRERSESRVTPVPLESAQNSGDPAPTRGVTWFGLAACASAMLMAITNHICQNIAVVPLLWVLPLSIYLLSFIVCFERERWYSFSLWSIFLAIGTVLVSFAYRHPQMNLPLQIVFYLSALLGVCMVCHGEAARLKPATGRLTFFYLLLACGGVAGSAFVVVVAPFIFRTYFWELPIALWAAWVLFVWARMGDRTSWLRLRNPWLLAVAIGVILAGLLGNDPAKWREAALFSLAVTLPALLLFSRKGQTQRLEPRDAWYRAAFALVLMAIFLPVYSFSHPVAVSRNFYGILTVSEGTDEGDKMYALKNGRILHGAQFVSPQLRSIPTSYYGPESGVGYALMYDRRRVDGQPLRVGAVGLGVGTIAAYGRPGDYFRFYELNPEDIRLADFGPPLYFTFLRDTLAKVEVIEGDARVRLEQELKNHTPQAFDVLVLDAFTGDAIPLHLLTREAFAVYLPHLASDGILAFHISNDAVDLRPVLAGIGQHYGLRILVIDGRGQQRATTRSVWVLLARTETALEPIAKAAKVSLEDPRSGGLLWTDDFSNILQVLK